MPFGVRGGSEVGSPYQDMPTVEVGGGGGDGRQSGQLCNAAKIEISASDCTYLLSS
jgi:hypothetical protein